MHFILIDLIRYLWRGPAANFAGSRRLANCSSQTIATMIIVITIIAVLFSSPSCNLISVHLIIIVRRQGGASSRPTLNKWSFSVRGLWWGYNEPIRGQNGGNWPMRGRDSVRSVSPRQAQLQQSDGWPQSSAALWLVDCQAALWLVELAAPGNWGQGHRNFEN